ncbi:MAG: dihydroneopterin aldolase family protein [Candidatus Thermoplasmatota archaeon]|nr:dihydroneopterin aldolase family protein [Candidatus Thermoplasmatota archaeon]MCL5888532.1 dihydroneopterin aldolase family protein [Candidatus Thermoplasmatota archaeon]
MNDEAASYFHCTDRERAVFEAGIKLGSIYHQYIGIPMNLTNIEAIETAIRQSVMVQPFVEKADVRINKSMVKKTTGHYKYETLKGEMLDVSLTVKYKSEEVRVRMRYVEKLDYPLMTIEE